MLVRRSGCTVSVTQALLRRSSRPAHGRGPTTTCWLAKMNRSGCVEIPTTFSSDGWYFCAGLDFDGGNPERESKCVTDCHSRCRQSCLDSLTLENKDSRASRWGLALGRTSCRMEQSIFSARKRRYRFSDAMKGSCRRVKVWTLFRPASLLALFRLLTTHAWTVGTPGSSCPPDSTPESSRPQLLQTEPFNGLPRRDSSSASCIRSCNVPHRSRS